MDGEKKRTAGRSRRASTGRPRRSASIRVLEDVSAITAASEDLQDNLQQIVEVVAERTGADVCSLYILDTKAHRLTLWATAGLDRGAIGKVSMNVGEGLTGMVIEKLEPVLAVDAAQHPRYRYFPETGEEKYHSYVGVPVIERRTPLGVLVLQTLRQRTFTKNEIRLLKAIAQQVGGIVVQARLLEEVTSEKTERHESQRRMLAAIKRLQAYEKASIEPGVDGGKRSRLSGQPAAPGFGRGKAHLLQAPVRFDTIDDRDTDDPAHEIGRVKKAIRKSLSELDRLAVRLSKRMPEFDEAIIDAHRAMLEDRGFTGKVEQVIAKYGVTAEAALRRVVDELVAKFEAMSAPYLRERVSDVKDVGLRLLRNLMGIDEPDRALERDSILVAEDVTLSDLTLIQQDRLSGIVLATGGVTSHASILARSFEIPTVVGVEHVGSAVREGDDLLVDGNAGVIFVDPAADVVKEYERLDREYRAFNRALDAEKDLPAETSDGHRVSLHANIGLVGDVLLAHRHGAEGVGLYRTEFPFLSYRDFPDEEEQYQIYARVVRGMEGRQVTIRTLDLGADKYPGYLRPHRENNPFLGWRSIRISLEMPDVFRVQLRAILRAATLGRVRIMFPMISGLEEIRRAKALLEEAKEELRQERKDFNPAVSVGMMIEVPSAVVLATQLVREVDFFSIGTNDLIQYLLAVDRDNPKVAKLYTPLHPAVLTAINETVHIAKGAGKGVSMCGEMAADPLCALLLLGMGLDDLSMGPFFIPVIRRIVRTVSYSTARAVTRDVLKLSTVQEVKGYLFDAMKQFDLLEALEMYH